MGNLEAEERKAEGRRAEGSRAEGGKDGPVKEENISAFSIDPIIFAPTGDIYSFFKVKAGKIV